MRPITRGDVPTRNGATVEFTHYSKALPHLVDRIGLYCSYCGKKIDNSPEVEHMCPKSVDPSLTLDWNNFLLACRNCNSIKGTHPDNVNDFETDYYWPDMDDTFNIFVYENTGKIRVKDSVSPEIKDKANKTLKLTGLNRPFQSRNDNILRKRKRAWSIAEDSLNDLNKCNTVEMKNQIIRTALSRGHWSIWMTVFKDENDILKRLIYSFPGTNTEFLFHICPELHVIHENQSLNSLK